MRGCGGGFSDNNCHFDLDISVRMCIMSPEFMEERETPLESTDVELLCADIASIAGRSFCACGTGLTGVGR